MNVKFRMYSDEEVGFIRGLLHNNMKYKDIKECFDNQFQKKISISKITRIIKGIKGTLSNRGRKDKFSNQEKDEIQKIIEKNSDCSWNSIMNSVYDNLGKSISFNTIYKYSRKMGIYCYVRKHKPLITQQTARKRLAFARKYVSKSVSFWRESGYADEKTILLKGKLCGSKLFVKCKKKDLFLSKNLRVKNKYNFIGQKYWSLVGYRGVCQLIEVSKWNSSKYQTTIKEPLKKAIRKLKLSRVFEDGYSVKSSNSTKKFYKMNKFNMIKLPPVSPDINHAIESTWHHWQQAVWRNNYLKTISALRIACVDK